MTDRFGFVTGMELDVVLSLKSHRHRYWRGVLFVIAVAASVAAVLATATDAFAQTEVPDAPTAVAVVLGGL